MKSPQFSLALLTVAAVLPFWNAYAGDVGGAHGGGGNIRPMHPIAQEQVEPLIRKEQWEAELFYNQLEIDWKRDNNGSCPNDLCRKLFDGDRTVFDVLKVVTVDYKESSKCVNPRTHKEQDGAAYLTPTDTICLSPYSMAPQMDRMAARAQSLALFVHEVSHLVGTTDEDEKENDAVAYPFGEATFLQDLAIEAFYSRRAPELADRVKNAKERMAVAFEQIGKLLALSDVDLWRESSYPGYNYWPSVAFNLAWEELNEAFSPESNRFAGDPYWADAELPMPILRWSDIALLDEGDLVGEMLRGYPKSPEKDERYGKVFGADTVLSYAEFRLRYMPAEAPGTKTYGLPLPSTPIYQAKNAAAIRADLGVMKKIYDVFQARMDSYGAVR